MRVGEPVIVKDLIEAYEKRHGKLRSLQSEDTKQEKSSDAGENVISFFPQGRKIYIECVANKRSL